MLVQREEFSDQSFAVQVTLRGTGPDTVVDQVLIGARPPGLYGAAAKSHLVPWLAFCDALRAEVTGQAPAEALNRVLRLATWARGLPSQKLAGSLRTLTAQELRARARAEEKAAAAEPDTDMDGEKGEKDEDEAPQPVKRRRVEQTRTDSVLEAVLRAEVDDSPEADLRAPGRTPAAWHALAGEHLNAAVGAALGVPGEAKPSSYAAVLQDLMVAYLHFRNTVPLAAVPLANPAGAPDSAPVREWEQQLAADPDAVMSADEVRVLREKMWGLLDRRAVFHVAKEPYGPFDAEQVPLICDELEGLAVADHVVTMEITYPCASARTRFRTSVEGFFDDPFDVAAAMDGIENFSKQPVKITGRVARFQPADDDAEVEQETGDIYERFAVQLGFQAHAGTLCVGAMYVGARPKAPAGRHSTAWVALCDYTRALIVGQPLSQVTGRLDAARDTLNQIVRALGARKVLGPRRVANPTNRIELQGVVAEFLSDLNAMPDAITETGGTSGGGGEGILRRRVRDDHDPSALRAMLDPKVLQWKQGSRAERGVALRLALHLAITQTAYPDAALNTDLVSETGLAGFLHDVNIQPDAICTAVLRALRPTEAYDPIAYEEALDRYSSENTRKNAAKERRNPAIDRHTEYRPSQDPDASSESSGSQ